MNKSESRIGLFRKEVVLNQHKIQYGSAIGPNTKAFIIFPAIFVFLTACSVAWLFIGTYKDRITAPGHITITSGYDDIKAPKDGTVNQVLVAEGDYVNKGQLLAKLSTGINISKESTFSDQMIGELKLQAVEVKAKLNRTPELEKNQITLFSLEQLELGSVIVQIDQTIEIEKEILELKRIELEAYTSESALASTTLQTRNALKEDYLQQKRKLQESENQKKQIQSRLDELPYLIEQSKVEMKDKKSDLIRELSILNQQVNGEKVNNEIHIYSSLDGVVSGLDISLNNEVRVNDVLMSVVPIEAEYIAEVHIPASRGGMIQEGQSVSIRYHAFHSHKFGIKSGTIRTISNSLTYPRTSALTPQMSNEPFFKATVELAEPYVVVGGNNVGLKVGMTLIADIETFKLPIIDWLLRPLNGY